ncbi:MAG: alpha-2-macroglobulin family protein, partial [Nakamurella sp.]
AISPKLAGSWQWIGTSTLRFAADSKDFDRLPMATNYTVTVPAGTRSVNGGTLGKAATFKFATPPPTVKQFAPTGSSMKLDPVFVAVFDQKMEPDAVLRAITATAGKTSWPMRLATAKEVAADSAAAKATAAAPGGRVVVFRPVRNLPVDQPITVTFAAGTPSAEGPRATTKAATFTGHTYAALKLASSQCECYPSSQLVLTFNNALDASVFDPTTVKVTPEIPGGATVTVADKNIVVQGATQPDTSYTVTVPAGLVDSFGQKLAAPAKESFKISPATARLDPFPQPITTLDPMVDAPSLTVNTVNRKEFRERVFAVSPADWADYRPFYVKSSQASKPNTVLDVPDWPVLVDRTVQINGQPNRLASTTLDLSAALSRTGSTGNVVVLIEPTSAETFSNETYWQNRPTMTWAQKTTIGLDALNDSTQLRAWATDLRDGSPLAGVTVGMVDRDGVVEPARTATNGADGIASLALRATGAGALIARLGDQTALLPSQMWDNSWQTTPTQDRLLWFVNDDRQTYRPGETVSVKGWVRRQGGDVAAALTAIPRGSKVSYAVRDSYGTGIGHGTTDVSTLGGFDVTVPIPAGANLGNASIDFTLTKIDGVPADPFTHTFEIADFRTPDFEVATHGDSKSPYVSGDKLTVATDATYYAGGPLGGAQVNWQVRTAAATYAPPGWSQYTFGIWTPWWQVDDAGLGQGPIGGGPGGSYQPCCTPVDPDTSKVEKFAGSTDSGGSNYLQVQVGDLGAKYSGLPVAVTAQATVTDTNRQAIAGTTDLLVHPASYYVGLASDDTFVNQGKDLVVHAIATGIDGAAAVGLKIDMTASKVTTSMVNGVSVDAESDTEHCAVTSTTGPVSCTFKPPAAGSYRITATVTDKAGRTSRSELTRWVAGPDGSVDSSVQRQQLTLVPDKKDYQPGEKAQLLVQSPIRSGSGLLTVLHNGIVATAKFAVKDGSAVVSLPITDAEIPGVAVSIEVVGTAPRTASGKGAAVPQRPAYATGGIDLTISTQARTLKVTAKPRQSTVAPGGATKLDVTVADQRGKPVAGSEFEVVVADEAVLALGGYQLPDPLQSFYPQPDNWLSTVYGRSTVMLTDQRPPEPSTGEGASAAAGASSAASSAAPAASGGLAAESAASQRALANAPTSAGSPIAERQNFDALALFVPSATTDANGRATIDVPLPDNLTRYRVMVVAVAGATQFGSTDATITAALPLTVRPSAPPFLNFGDTLQLLVLVQNQTNAALTTDVVIQAANLKVTGPAGQQVRVPAHGRVEVQFPFSADQAGTAKFRVAAVSGDDADAASIQLPVYTPTTTESFASYGTVGGGNVLRQPVSAPTGVVGQFGGLQISTSSTALQQLTDAVGYLADYDYDSSDALAAQVIAIGSLGDVLQAFSAPALPSAATLKALVAGDVKKLTTLQNDDGGFAYWQHGEKSDPFNSIQATQALLVAAEHGSKVGKDNLARAQQYLTKIDSHIPAEASQQTKDTLRAYALRVRMQGGHRDPAAADAMVAERGSKLPLDAVAWLLPVVTDGPVRANLAQLVGNAAVDDAGSVTFTNAVTDDAWTTLQSDRRTDGLVLDALIATDPGSDLIPKIVSGLMAAQKSGRWDNVQENAFILLALRHYYDAFEKTTPDFVGGVWLGDRFAGQHDFTGHTTERATVTIPTANLIAAGDSDVTVRNDGTGTLYYRLGLQT